MLICRIARLALVAGAETGFRLEPLFLALEEKTQELYHRPYLAKGLAERTLLMLSALLEVLRSC